MRLGVISDTHGLLRPQVFEAFAEVDHIIHAGDVGSMDIITELEAIAPVTAVYGNTDDGEIRSKLPRVAELQLDGFQLVVTHGDQYGRGVPNEKFHGSCLDADILVHGHTHLPKVELVD